MQYKTEWDLTHIYKGDAKAQVAKDVAALKKAYAAFAKKYRADKKHLKNAKSLAKAIEEYETLIANPIAGKAGQYYSYRTNLNSEDDEAVAELSKLSDFYTDLQNEVQFFILEIAKIDKNIQKKFLKTKELAPFKYFLTKIFENAKHHLSEAEEKIMNLNEIPAYEMWVSGFARLLSKQTVNFEGKEIPVSEAGSKIPTLKTTERRELHKKVMKAYEKVADFAESEMN